MNIFSSKNHSSGTLATSPYSPILLNFFATSTMFRAQLVQERSF